jgi:hypothetical protein
MHKKIGKLYSRSSEREKERKIGKIKNVWAAVGKRRHENAEENDRQMQ